MGWIGVALWWVGVATAAEAPAIEDITELSLEELLGGTSGGGTGAFGGRLDQYGITPYLHAYVTSDLVYEPNQPTSFDAHYFNIMVGADIRGRVIPEAQLEYEHGGDEIQLRYGQVDLRADDLFVVRTGKFLVPFGEFNPILYPEFISKTPDRPFALRELVPVAWAEVGLQLHGELEMGEERGARYAVYVVNGLEQADDPLTPGVEDGGSIRDMRNNHRDQNHGNKAVGGRLAANPLPWMRVGASGYAGAYTVDGRQQLLLGGADLSLRPGDLTLLSEVVFARQQARGGDLSKVGAYLQGAYRVAPPVEPVLQFDWIALGGDPALDRTRGTGGLVLYPFPREVPTALVKATWATTWTADGAAPTHRAVGQVAVGF